MENKFLFMENQFLLNLKINMASDETFWLEYDPFLFFLAKIQVISCEEIGLIEIESLPNLDEIVFTKDKFKKFYRIVDAAKFHYFRIKNEI
jgi:hypothetical protein